MEYSRNFLFVFVIFIIVSSILAAQHKPNIKVQAKRSYENNDSLHQYSEAIDPEVSISGAPDEINLGESFFIEVHLKNTGSSTTEWGYLDISFPNNPDVELDSKNPNLDNDAIYPPGSLIYHKDGYQFNSSYTLVAAEELGWSTNEDQWVKLKVTPISAGNQDIYYRGTIAGIIAPSSSLYTDQQGWPVFRKTVKVNSVGDLKVTVENIDGTVAPYPDDNGKIKLYNNNDELVDQEDTYNGVATFTDIPTGSEYWIEVFHDFNPSTVFGEEYWGKKTNLTINENQNTTEFTRYMPYTESIKVFNGNNDITGNTVQPNTALTIKVTVKNNGSAISTRARLLLDRSKNDPYEFDQLSNYSSIAGGGNTKIYDFSYTPTENGSYYAIAGVNIKSSSLGERITDGYSWNDAPLFKVESLNGNLNVTVEHIDGNSQPLPGSNGNVKLYNSNWQPLNKSANTNSSGVATFSNLAFGTYNLEAYHNPSNPTTIFGVEFWGGKVGVNHNQSTTSVPLSRNMPYAEDKKIYIESTNQLITGGNVQAGTELRIEVTVKNPNSSSLSVKARLVLDRNKSSSYDFDTTSTSNTVNGDDGTVTFIFNYTPQTTGDYFGVIGTQTYINNSYQYTDGWAWPEGKWFGVIQNQNTIKEWTTIKKDNVDYNVMMELNMNEDISNKLLDFNYYNSKIINIRIDSIFNNQAFRIKNKSMYIPILSNSANKIVLNASNYNPDLTFSIPSGDIQTIFQANDDQNNSYPINSLINLNGDDLQKIRDTSPFPGNNEGLDTYENRYDMYSEITRSLVYYLKEDQILSFFNSYSELIDKVDNIVNTAGFLGNVAEKYAEIVAPSLKLSVDQYNNFLKKAGIITNIIESLNIVSKNVIKKMLVYLLMSEITGQKIEILFHAINSSPSNLKDQALINAFNDVRDDYWLKYNAATNGNWRIILDEITKDVESIYWNSFTELAPLWATWAAEHLNFYVYLALLPWKAGFALWSDRDMIRTSILSTNLHQIIVNSIKNKIFENDDEYYNNIKYGIANHLRYISAYLAYNYVLEYLKSWLVNIGSWLHFTSLSEAREFYKVQSDKARFGIINSGDPWYLAGFEGSFYDQKWLASKINYENVIEAISKPSISTDNIQLNVNDFVTITGTNAVSNIGSPVEYFFNYGDGSNSGWGSSNTTKSYNQPGSYIIKTKARSKINNQVESNWSNEIILNILQIEVISKPYQPDNPSIATVNEKVNISSSGALSSTGNEVEYQFSWGDGFLSNWGNNNREYEYKNIGEFFINARARIKNNPLILSDWSDPSSIKIISNPKTISVSSPAEGESWLTGSQQNILWTSVNITSNVNIKLSLDGGSTFPILLASNISNDGIEEIVVPNNPSLTCRVKVESIEDPNIYGLNPGIFSISQNEITQNLSLDSWNIFSLYVTPSNTNLKDIIQPLIDNNSLVKIIDERGNAIEKINNTWHNFIGNWQSSEGYRSKVNSQNSLQITGIPVTLPFTTSLSNGWNIFSYPSIISQNALTVLQPLIDANILVKVIDESGNAIEFINGGWINEIYTFDPGKGYRIKVNSDADITINQPAIASNKPSDNKKLETEFFKSSNIGNPFSVMNIYVLLENAKKDYLQDIKEIAVFDGDLLVGASSIDPSKEYVSLIARADDPTTEERDGYAEGNIIHFKVWDGNEERRYFAEIVKEENKEEELKFRSLGSIIVKLNSISRFINNPGEVTLFDNYPNPFNPTSTFSFYLPEQSKVDLTIFSINGEEIKNLAKGEFNGGIHQVIWDGNNENGELVTSGIYFYRLVTINKMQVKKLIFLK